MADAVSSEESSENSGGMMPRPAKRVTTQYFSTARTAPRGANEHRIGTDEAHERLQAARNQARRDVVNIRMDDVSADH
jgi:hypothetical protein